jgi:hypothetical protein
MEGIVNTVGGNIDGALFMRKALAQCPSAVQMIQQMFCTVTASGLHETSRHNAQQPHEQQKSSSIVALVAPGQDAQACVQFMMIGAASAWSAPATHCAESAQLGSGMEGLVSELVSP